MKRKEKKINKKTVCWDFYCLRIEIHAMKEWINELEDKIILRDILKDENMLLSNMTLKMQRAGLDFCFCGVKGIILSNLVPTAGCLVLNRSNRIPFLAARCMWLCGDLLA